MRALHSRSFLRNPVAVHHGVLSFPPGVGTPELVHGFGTAFAEACWGDRYMVLIATHLNRPHLHCHFVLRTASLYDGRQYRPNPRERNRCDAVLDRLCASWGFPADEARFRSWHYAAQMAWNAGKETFWDGIRADLDRAVSVSVCRADFLAALRALGYRAEIWKEDGSLYPIPAISLPASESFLSLKKLRDGYTPDDLDRRIRTTERFVSAPVFTHAEEARFRFLVRSVPSLCPEETDGIARFLRYTDILNALHEERCAVPWVSAEMRMDLLHLPRLLRQRERLQKECIETEAELEAKVQALEERIEALCRDRKRLHDKTYRLRKKGLETDAAAASETAADRTKAIAPLRELLRDCRDVTSLLPSLPEKLAFIDRSREYYLQRLRLRERETDAR